MSLVYSLAYVRAEHLRRHIKSHHMGLKGGLLVSIISVHWGLTAYTRTCL